MRRLSDVLSSIEDLDRDDEGAQGEAVPPCLDPSEWKQIPGYDGRYVVARDGRVMGLSRGNRWGELAWRPCKVVDVTVVQCGTARIVRTSRLVELAFGDDEPSNDWRPLPGYPGIEVRGDGSARSWRAPGRMWPSSGPFQTRASPVPVLRYLAVRVNKHPRARGSEGLRKIENLVREAWGDTRQVPSPQRTSGQVDRGGTLEQDRG